MTSGLQMKFGAVTSAPIPFGTASDAVVVDRVRAFALAKGIVQPTDAGQVMADKVATYAAAQFVATVVTWVEQTERKAGEAAALAKRDAYFEPPP
jgi:hypothetical protein